MHDRAARFPLVAGILLGLGLGGFFDGILLHQILQWHHMVTSAGYPATSLGNLEFNVTLDGLFHAVTYIFTASGLAILWQSARKTHFWWSPKLLVATMLIGFGIFNVVEGVLNHHLLGLHHVNETAPRQQWALLGHRFFDFRCSDRPFGMATVYAGAARNQPRRDETSGSQSSTLAKTSIRRKRSCLGRSCRSPSQGLRLRAFDDRLAAIFDEHEARRCDVRHIGGPIPGSLRRPSWGRPTSARRQSWLPADRCLLSTGASLRKAGMPSRRLAKGVAKIRIASSPACRG